MRIVAIVVSLGITAIAVALAMIAVQQMLKVIKTGKSAGARPSAHKCQLNMGQVG